MREAKIVIPQYFNDGMHIAMGARSRIDKAIIGAFGGFTMSQAKRAWNDPDTHATVSEIVDVYHIAADSSVSNNYALERIAAMVASLCEQKSVYCVDFYGEVQFYEPDQEEEIAT